jgi:hypothetical protein
LSQGGAHKSASSASCIADPAPATIIAFAPAGARRSVRHNRKPLSRDHSASIHFFTGVQIVRRPITQ